MRVLDFDVNNQKITKSPKCDFGGLVVGSSGFLYARFNFSHEWVGYKRVAVFTCKSGEYPVMIQAGICEIPPEVLACNSFKVSVVGKRGDSMLPSNRVTVIQRRY